MTTPAATSTGRPASDSRAGVTVDWGRTRYEPAWREQEKLVAQRIEGAVPDTLVLTEHEPAFTVGLRSGAEANLIWGAETLAAQGVELVKTNRGGDITYHGPGQLVGYPIVDLSHRRDLHAYLRFLEQVLINVSDCLGLVADRRPGKTGIWIGTRKVAAIGVAVRRWVTYHGFALNVAPNLAHFDGIVPCGIQPSDGTVTSLSVELRRPISLDEVKALVATQFWKEWTRFCSGGPE